jgi:hypothetical protein
MIIFQSAQLEFGAEEFGQDLIDLITSNHLRARITMETAVRSLSAGGVAEQIPRLFGQRGEL